MPNTLFIDTNELPRKQTSQGELTEILNNELAGAKNVLGMLRWLKPGEKFNADASDKHQLIYLMDGQGSITLERKEHEVRKGMGVYLGPSETATIQAAPGRSLKLFHLVVPQIPR
jgi:quercetin dioxygenase-like cupin family protein